MSVIINRLKVQNKKLAGIYVVNSGLKMLFYGGLKMSFFSGLRLSYI
ncbi:Uncharacterised protein [Staphylococcus aureus]|nr:Uncharacterised protein [Staphylococcus aureus]